MHPGTIAFHRCGVSQISVTHAIQLQSSKFSVSEISLCFLVTCELLLYLSQVIIVDVANVVLSWLRLRLSIPSIDIFFCFLLCNRSLPHSFASALSFNSATRPCSSAICFS